MHVQEGYWKERGGRGTYYAEPPQNPSIAMSTKHIVIATPSLLSGTKPVADSTANTANIAAWIAAGRYSSLAGSGGRPSEMEEREMNTAAWYTSYIWRGVSREGEEG